MIGEQQRRVEGWELWSQRHGFRFAGYTGDWHPIVEPLIVTTANALANVIRLWGELTRVSHDPGNVVVSPELYDALDRLNVTTALPPEDPDAVTGCAPVAAAELPPTPSIVATEDTLEGMPRIAGTRIPVVAVLRAIALYVPLDGVLTAHSHLTLEQAKEAVWWAVEALDGVALPSKMEERIAAIDAAIAGEREA
jgi:uncharacterized protein (DUF433 family)